MNYIHMHPFCKRNIYLLTASNLGIELESVAGHQNRPKFALGFVQSIRILHMILPELIWRTAKIKGHFYLKNYILTLKIIF